MRVDLLAEFAAKGPLPPKEVAHWRVLEQGEGVSQPRSSEVISFLTFHERELEYLAHWLLHELLNGSGLELQHLNPLGVVTVREAFLGLEPHVDLFWRIFSG